MEYRTTPKGATLITKEELAMVIKEIHDSFTFSPDGKTKAMDSTKEEIEVGLYDMVIGKLRQKRWFFEGLSHSIIVSVFRDISQDTIFKPSASSSAVWDEYDKIVWKKVNEMEYSEKRLAELKKALKIGS